MGARGMGVSDNNRRARFYELTKGGRRQLDKETTAWQKLVRSIGFVLGPEAARG
jgi:DNA-binding MarR family transcriptional regulator